jgi:MFS family permease
MQNVVLPAYVYHRTGKASVVGLLIFAQLGPLLFLSIPAGVIADRFNRKKWLVSMQVVQLSFSLALATLALGTPPIWALFAAAFGVGIGNALNAPAWSAMLPSLVDPQHLSGAIALNSTVINGSRVVGPIIVAVFSQFGYLRLAQCTYSKFCTRPNAGLATLYRWSLYRSRQTSRASPHRFTSYFFNVLVTVCRSLSCSCKTYVQD